ncbi:selenium metabolism protein YedF [Sedimentibacter acidaminivorans]|uniref:Selenium metabolism protein YedF n=1 Tax=Sedimentibacter acidaminivorans TaxID=913099 RepID=A0ABS4GF26_9FIRM|nr:sulfurtransferase-like selenium metabolism protein YedF [Sedimentibacter acidaminivorans]MBP1926279.1 selenium metabolism protein YedF [Sedimentibacter acidaminivorans]
MKIVDARGKTCPQPVIMTKKEIDLGENSITTIVDNETAKQNIIKLGTKLNYSFSELSKEDGIYITLNKGETIEEVDYVSPDIELSKLNKGFVFGTDVLGSGSDKLGKMLMKGFIYTITETKPYPNFIVFLNSGVKLTTEGSESLDDLKKLEGEGVKIVSCGTCLDFFEIKTKLAVGQVSNMYDIVEIITNSDNAVMI